MCCSQFSSPRGLQLANVFVVIGTFWVCLVDVQLRPDNGQNGISSLSLLLDINSETRDCHFPSLCVVSAAFLVVSCVDFCALTCAVFQLSPRIQTPSKGVVKAQEVATEVLK